MWAVSTLPGGSLAMAMWPCSHDQARAFVDNVGNVPTIFFSLPNVGVGVPYIITYIYLTEFK